MGKTLTPFALLLFFFSFSPKAFCLGTGGYGLAKTAESSFLSPDTIPNPLLPADTTLCEARVFRLSIPDPGPGISIEWSDGSTDTLLVVNTSGAYWLSLSGSGIELSDTINIRFIGAEWAGLPGDTTLCGQESWLLDATFEGAGLYLWHDGSQEPTFEADRPGKYLVKVVVEECTLQDSLQVSWCEPCIALPNAFTPNGDGANDTFAPIIQCPAQQYEFRVYNRWGRLVFETKNPQESWDGAWDGQPQASDTYFYTLIFQSAFSEPVLKRQGDVSLLR